MFVPFWGIESQYLSSLVEHNRDESFLQCNMLSSGTELWTNILFMVPSNWIWTRGLVNHMIANNRSKNHLNVCAVADLFVLRFCARVTMSSYRLHVQSDSSNLNPCHIEL